MRSTIALLLLLFTATAAAAQTAGPAPLPKPSPFPPASVIYQWDYACPNSTAGSMCFSSLGFPVMAVSMFLVDFPVGNSTTLMSCYIATLTSQSVMTGWNTSCAPAGSGFSFSERGMVLNYAGNPNAH